MLSDLGQCVEAAAAAADNCARRGDVNGANVANLVHLRAACALQRVVKALSTRAVGLARRSLSSAAPQLLALATRFVVQCGAQLVDAVVARRVAPDARTVTLYETGSKLARRLLRCAVVDLNAAQTLLSDELDRVASFVGHLNALRELGGDGSPHTVAVRVCALACKLATECIEQRGAEFAACSAAYVRAAYALLEAASDGDAESAATTRAMLLLCAVVDSPVVRESPSVAPLVSVDPLAQLVELLVTRYYPLRDSELVAWRDEPETFFAEQDTDYGLATPRSTAKSLTVKSLRALPTLAAPIAAMLQRLAMQANAARASANSGAAQFEAARALDACYALAGVAAFELHDHVDFGSWFRSQLAPTLEVATTNDGCVALLQRRVLWLLSDWLNDVDATLRAPLCAALTTLVASESSDLVVRLTAVLTLRACKLHSHWLR